jgi:hypothetical protein
LQQKAGIVFCLGSNPKRITYRKSKGKKQVAFFLQIKLCKGRLFRGNLSTVKCYHVTENKNMNNFHYLKIIILSPEYFSAKTAIYMQVNIRLVTKSPLKMHFCNIMQEFMP